MNIRKGHDYTALFAGIGRAICADLPQMELYCELGRLICARPEKGAAVAAAMYLSAQKPEMSGFSPRNLRRMRDFYKIYAGMPELLAQAMRLGWTQNVVILEADLTLDERGWYIQTAGECGWSKLELKRKIESAAHLENAANIDKEKPVCYTDNKVEKEPAMMDTSCASATEPEFDTGDPAKAQAPWMGGRAMGCFLNSPVSFQQETDCWQRFTGRSRSWPGRILTGKQRQRLCYAQVGG